MNNSIATVPGSANATLVYIGKETTSVFFRYQAYVQIDSRCCSVRIWALDPKNSRFARTHHCDIELCIEELLSPGVLAGNRSITPNVLSHFGSTNGEWLRGSVSYLVSTVVDSDFALKPFYTQAISTDHFGKTQFERKPYLSLLALYVPVWLIDEIAKAYQKYVEYLHSCSNDLIGNNYKVLSNCVESAMKSIQPRYHTLGRVGDLSGQDPSNSSLGNSENDKDISA